MENDNFIIDLTWDTAIYFIKKKMFFKHLYSKKQFKCTILKINSKLKNTPLNLCYNHKFPIQ